MAAQRHLPHAIQLENLAAPQTMVRALLDAGADANARRQDGRRALMNGAMMGWPGVVEMLPRAKAT